MAILHVDSGWRGERMNPEDEPTDDALVAASALGDKAAFARLVARHARALTMLAARITGDRAQAEDVVQETFTRAWIKAPTWRAGPGQGHAPYAAWLTRVAANLSIDQRRRVVPLHLDAAPDPADPAPDASVRLEQSERAAALRRAVAALAPRQRAAISLTYDLGLSNIEAATALQTSVGALELLLVRARKALRAALQDEEAGHDA